MLPGQRSAGTGVAWVGFGELLERGQRRRQGDALIVGECPQPLTLGEAVAMTHQGHYPATATCVTPKDSLVQGVDSPPCLA